MKKLWVGLLLAGLLMTPAQAETVTYLHTDLLGSVVLETDQNRNVVARYEYEPYGLPRQAIADAPGYTGHVHDAGSGLVHMQQRYYDPEVGRCLSIDPVGVDTGTGGNFNRYWYGNDNPYRYVDPDGRIAIDTFVDAAFVVYDTGRFIGAVAAAVVGTVTGNDALQSAGLEGMRETGVDLSASVASAVIPGVAAPIMRQADEAAKPLMGRNAEAGGSRTNTDAGPNGNRATAKSIFRNQAEGSTTTTRMENGGMRTRAENGVQVRHNPDGSSRVDMPNRGSAPHGESLHTPPPPPPPRDGRDR